MEESQFQVWYTGMATQTHFIAFILSEDVLGYAPVKLYPLILTTFFYTTVDANGLFLRK